MTVCVIYLIGANILGAKVSIYGVRSRDITVFLGFMGGSRVEGDLGKARVLQRFTGCIKRECDCIEKMFDQVYNVIRDVINLIKDGSR